MDDDEDEGTGNNIIPFQPPRATKAYRPRSDGFTPEKKRRFFKALRKTGCLTDAARAAGVSTNTVRRHRDRWEDFDSQVDATLALASVALDTIAWKRATQGTEEKVYRDGRLVFTRVKPSDAMLRLLMQGANPEKYGRMGRMIPRATIKKLKKEARRDARAEMRASIPELTASLNRHLAVLRARKAAGLPLPGPGEED